MVVHSPHAKTPASARASWWKKLHRLFAGAGTTKDVWPLLLIDANARVGQEPSELIGTYGAEAPNENTAAFQDFLQEFSLCLPSSFEGHNGDTPTWSSPAGHRARLDYVGVPVAMHPAVAASWNFEVPLPREHEDHDAVAVMSLPRCRQSPPPLGLLSSVSETGLGRALGGLPPTPWHTGLDAHAGLLCAELRFAIVPFCTPRGRQPREPFVTPAVLDAIAVKQHHRAALRQAGPSPAATLLQLFRDSCKAVRTLLRQAKRNYLEGLADDFEQASLGKDTAKLYRALKPFRTAAGKKTNLRHVACVGKGDDLCHVPEDAHHVWETHFGGIEGGVVTSAEALVAKHRKAITRAVPQQTFPSLMDWERQFHGLARGKAPGADSLRSDHYHAAPAAFTAASFPLALKAGVTGAEPLRWKGGLAFPLYKGKGDPSKPENHRSILLAEMLSKRYHKWIRSSLVPIFLHAKLPLHAGVAGHLSTGIPSLSLRAFQARMEETRQSYGLLFLDLKSAFYSVLRQFLVGDSSQLGFFRWLRQFGFDEEQASHVQRTLVSHAPSDQLWGDFVSRLQGILDSTWFVFSGSSRVVAKKRG